MPHIVPISRRVCGALCLASGPLTPLDMALWVSVVADAAALVHEPDEDGLTTVDAWVVEDAAALHVAGRTLLAGTGLRRHSELARPFARLAESRVNLATRIERTFALWHGWEADPVNRGNPCDVGIVSGIVMALTGVHGDPFPVAVDTLAMARFSCRWSPWIYMRALAWLNGAGTPKAWRRTAPGDHVEVTIPIEQLERGLGNGVLRGVADWNARALGTGAKGGPVHADLASAGLQLTTEWVMGRYGLRPVPIALRLSVRRLKRAKEQHKALMLAYSTQRPSARGAPKGIPATPIGL